MTVVLGAPATGGADFEHVLTRHTKLIYAGDLEEVKRRGVLRVLTRNNSSSYFIARGRQLGFQYEMARHFADTLGVRLAIVVPSSRAGLIPALLRGEGDLIAAGMTPTPARAKLVTFTPGLFEAQRVVVTHRSIIKRLERAEDLARFEIALSFRQTTYQMAKALEAEIGVPLRLRDVPGNQEMEEMLRRVATGEYEATIVDQNLYELQTALGAPLKKRLKVGAPLSKAWAVRPSAQQLAAAATAFIENSNKDGLSRINYHKYHKARARHARKAKDLEMRADAEGSISPYDDILQAEGERTGIDWRLLAAVAFAESRFDPTVESRFGAVGLMQVLVSTARHRGGLAGTDAEVVEQLKQPAVNIRVGAGYLKWLLARFDEPDVAPRQQIRFALAAYNVGLGHVADARELAAREGLDPNRWFQHVEEAMRLKKLPKYHETTRYGFCRAEQPIAYVSRIQTRYDAYVRHVTFE